MENDEEVWFDEETVVIELDGENEFLNNLLREALEKHDNSND
jgi:hypothetical protein